MTMLFSINTDPCIRCGLCCYYMIDGKVKKCKYLVRVWRSPSKTFCRAWSRRNAMLRAGKALVIDRLKGGRTVICIMRRESKYDYIGCPYNAGKELAPWCEGIGDQDK